MTKYKWRLLEDKGIARETLSVAGEGYEIQYDNIMEEPRILGPDGEEIYEDGDIISEEDIDEVLGQDDAERDTVDVELSDIMSDALLCNEASRLFMEHDGRLTEQDNQKVHKLTEYNFTIKEYLHCRKQIIEKIERTKKNQDVDPFLFNLVYELVEACRKKSASGHEIRERYQTLFQDERFRKTLEIIAEKIDAGEDIHYWLEKLVKSLGDTTVTRRKIVKLLRDSSKYPSSKNKPWTIQMIMEETQYDTYTSEAKQAHIAETERVVNAFTPGFIEYEDEFEREIYKMKDYINKYKGEFSEEYIFEKHNDEADGCYSLLHYGDEQVFALSSPFDYVESEIAAYYGFRPGTLQRYKDLIGNVQKLKDERFLTAKWARLQLKTKRYPYDGGWEFIPNAGETLEGAMVRNLDDSYKSRVKNDFNCCERKMFEYISEEENKPLYLFAKYEPCKKCKPAIRKIREKIKQSRIFYFESGKLKEWFDTEETESE